MTSIGVVVVWHPEVGWGVIDSPDISSGCWFHFSNLWTLEHPPLAPGESLEVSGQSGNVTVGETVDFDWEPAQQDGFSFRARDVRPRRQPPRRSIAFSMRGEPAPWPVDRFGELPHPGLWSERPTQ